MQLDEITCAGGRKLLRLEPNSANDENGARIGGYLKEAICRGACAPLDAFYFNRCPRYWRAGGIRDFSRDLPVLSKRPKRRQQKNNS